MTLAALAWVAIVGLSIAVEIAEQRPAGQSLPLFLGHFLTWLVRKFPMNALRDYPGVAAAALAGGGAALFAMTATLCRRDPSLVARTVSALVLSVAALGALNVNRLIEAALRRPPFLEALVDLHQTRRINTTFTDVNAAGALFVLMIPVALGLVGVRGHRWLAWTTTPFLLAGAWLSGSRTALAMLPVSVAILVIARATRRGGRGFVVAARASHRRHRGIGARPPRLPTNGSAWLDCRRLRRSPRSGRRRRANGAGSAALRRRDRPLLRSIHEVHAAAAPAAYRAQNAHNQYLQVLGELGVIGLASFAAIVAVGVGPALRTLARRAGDPMLAGLAIGCVTFLLIGLGMHPLLTGEVAVVFYVVLGLSSRGCKHIDSSERVVLRRAICNFAGESRGNLR